MRHVLVGVLLLALLAACGGDDDAATTPVATIGLTPIAATTPVATQAATAAQAAAAEPTTAPTSESTPIPDPTSISEKLTAEQVVGSLADAGLPVGEIRVWTAEDDPNELLGRPNRYTSKVTFHDTRLERAADEWDVDYGGDVEVFETDSDAESRETYIKGIIEALPLVTQWVYRHDTILLRLSHSLTPDQAAEYEAALMALE